MYDSTFARCATTSLFFLVFGTSFVITMVSVSFVSGLLISDVFVL